MDVLLGMIDWRLFAFQVVNGIVSTAIVTYALVRILPPRDPWACWACAFMITVGFLLFKQAMNPLGFALLSTVVYVAGYVAFLGGPLVGRAVVCILAQVVLLFAEIPAGIVWVALTGEPVMDVAAMFAHVPAYVVVSFFHAAATALFFYGFYRACRKVLCTRRNQLAGGQNTLWGGVFVLFPVVQLALLFMALSVPFVVIGDSMMFMVTAAVLFAVCIITDMFLFGQMRNYADARLMRARAKAMTEQVNAYLEAATAMQEALRDTAALRHDLRNHMQVVVGLCERGECAEAQAYMASAQKKLLGDGRQSAL